MNRGYFILIDYFFGVSGLLYCIIDVGGEGVLVIRFIVLCLEDIRGFVRRRFFRCLL